MAVYLGNNKITFDGISEIYVGSNKVYSATPVDYSTEYFFVENLTNNANTLSIKKSNASAPTITVYYSVDKTTWVSMGDTDTTEITYSIPARSKIYLKATTNKWSTNTYYNKITCSGNYAVGGNIMSLLYGDSFIGKTAFPTSTTYNLSRIFYNSTYLRNIENLVLPATTLTNSCYSNMFRGTSITTIPSTLLQATTLANNCYSQMFYGCTGLTTIPSNLLPATTLTTQCYSQMFYGCTGLTTIPSTLLHSTTLASNCYAYMFNGCTGLTSIPSTLLHSTTLASGCYQYMFQGCTSLTTIPSTLLHSTTLQSQCYYGMFRNCTGLTTIPSNLLPATTLASSCYSSMFSGCTSLTTIPSTLLHSTTLASSCYSSMFSGCTSLTKAPDLPATTLASTCYSGMFSGCTSLTTAPELPATTSQSTCYYQMFYNCSSLNEITCYANDISAGNCTSSWVSGVAASGTFYKKGSANWTTGIDGIPTGWTVIDDSPYNPINDYFWVENTKSSSVVCEFFLMRTYCSSTWGSLTYYYSINVKYSTNKTSWSTAQKPFTDATFIRITIPANTRYYFKSDTAKQATNSSSFNYTYGGTAEIEAWGACTQYGNSASASFSTVFRPNNSSDKAYIKLGGNIRTIIGLSDSGVGSTTSMSYERNSYNAGSYYTGTRSWLGTGTSLGNSWENNKLKSGLYFQYIKDASQLYIGSVDYKPDFLDCASDFVGPIYT